MSGAVGYSKADTSTSVFHAVPRDRYSMQQRQDEQRRAMPCHHVAHVPMAAAPAAATAPSQHHALPVAFPVHPTCQLRRRGLSGSAAASSHTQLRQSLSPPALHAARPTGSVPGQLQRSALIQQGKGHVRVCECVCASAGVAEQQAGAEGRSSEHTATDACSACRAAPHVGCPTGTAMEVLVHRLFKAGTTPGTTQTVRHKHTGSIQGTYMRYIAWPCGPVTNAPGALACAWASLLRCASLRMHQSASSRAASSLNASAACRWYNTTWVWHGGDGVSTSVT